MSINKNITKSINQKAENIPSIKKEKELLFCFNKISSCKKSSKLLKKQKLNNKFVECIFKFTEHFINSTDKSKIHYFADYKRLSGNGIKNSSHKFKVHQKYSVICNQEDNEEKEQFVIKLNGAGDYH